MKAEYFTFWMDAYLSALSGLGCRADLSADEVEERANRVADLAITRLMSMIDKQYEGKDYNTQ